MAKGSLCLTIHGPSRYRNRPSVLRTYVAAKAARAATRKNIGSQPMSFKKKMRFGLTQIFTVNHFERSLTLLRPRLPLLQAGF